ncbi:MAG: TetR/AcrR family transcriptional regulator [Candidatus Krumholzibacteria bacterium]
MGQASHHYKRGSLTGDLSKAAHLPRRERKKAILRERLFDTAMDLFETQGYDGTTVIEITERADVAKGTFFNYFPSKESVLLAYHEQLGREIHQRAERIARTPLSARDRFDRFFAQVSKIAKREKVRLAILIRQVVVYPGLVPRSGTVEREHTSWAFLWPSVLAIHRSFLEDGQERGELRGDIDSATAATIISSIWATTLIQWAFNDGGFSLQKAMSKRMDVLFAGLARREDS